SKQISSFQGGVVLQRGNAALGSKARPQRVGARPRAACCRLAQNRALQIVVPRPIVRLRAIDTMRRLHSQAGVLEWTISRRTRHLTSERHAELHERDKYSRDVGTHSTASS